MAESPVRRCDFDDAAETFECLAALASAVDLEACDDDDLLRLMSSIRTGQRALDHLVMRVGLAAEALVATGGVGANAMLLQTGSHVTGRTAHREAARVATLAALPAVAAAVASGSIGGPQVDAFGRALAKLDVDQQNELNDDELIGLASAIPIDTFNRAMTRAVDEIRRDHGATEARDKRERSSWKMWFDNETGMGHIHGEFDPERFEAIRDAIDAEVTRLANEGGGAKDHNLAAEAAHGLITGGDAGKLRLPHINVVVDWRTFYYGPHPDSIMETSSGHPLPPAAIARLACDATVQRIVIDERGIPINVGRNRRTATDAQWQATRSIYRACAWEGCDRPLSWCQLHHIQEWEHGGATDLNNLIPLCLHHHHLVHEGGWTVKLHSNRRLDLHRPDGSLFATTWPDRFRPGGRPTHTKTKKKSSADRLSASGPP